MPHIRYLQECGYEVECACAKTGFWFDELKRKHGLVVHEIDFARKPFKFKNIKAYSSLKKLVRGNNYSLINCHQPVGGAMGRLAGRACQIPVVYTAHGFHFFKGAPIRNRIIYKQVEKYCSKMTDALVIMNQEDFESAKKLRAKSVHLINGIGFDPNKNIEESEIEFQKNDSVILSVGELNKNKNHIVVINALKKLGNPNIKYVICGQGKLKKKLEGHENVVLLGYRKDVQSIMRKCDVFIMPSRREGLPMSMMEAMHNGLPIIASKIRGHVDLVQEGLNGILVDLDDKDGFKVAIQKIVEDPALCKSMGEQSQQVVRKFYIDEVVKQMEKIYKSVENFFNKCVDK